MEQTRPRINLYAEINGLEFMEEFISVFLHLSSCDEFEQVRERYYSVCPICNAKADSEGYIIHGEVRIN